MSRRGPDVRGREILGTEIRIPVIRGLPTGMARIAALFVVALLFSASLPAAEDRRAEGEEKRPVGEVKRPIAEVVRGADAAFDRGQYKEARTLYEEASRRGAQDLHTLRRLALLESWDGDLHESIACYRQALQLAPGDLDLSVELAKVLGWKNDLGGSIRLYEELRAKYPEDQRVLLGLGQALAWNGRYAEADALYRDMESKRLAAIEAHIGRARVLAWQGDFDRASHFYRDVLRADSMNLDARLGLAELEHWQGLDRAAREQADNIVLDHPESHEARRLQRTIHEALSPWGAVDAFRFSDNDSNRVDSATASYTFMAEPQTSVRIAYSAYDAEFRCRNEAFCDELGAGPAVDQVVSTHAGTLMAGVASRLIRTLSFQARGGATREESFDGSARTVAVGGGVIHWDVSPAFAIIGTGSREALVDTAPLIDKGIKVDGVGLRLEERFRPAWTLVGGAEYGSYSDGNARRSAVVSIEWRLPTSHPWVTGRFEARYRAFNADKNNGYFDPLRFDSELLTVAVWDNYRHDRMFWRIEGTWGRQAFNTGAGAKVEAGKGDTVEAVYASFGVGFGSRASLEAYYARSDYALQLATGFTSSRSGLALRFRF